MYALRRDSAEGLDHLLVLVNLDERQSQTVALDPAQCAGLGPLQYDLARPETAASARPPGDNIIFVLEPCAAFCLAPASKPRWV